MAIDKSTVLAQLNTGRAKAVPGKLLAKRLGERDTRQIRLTIQELREEGIPIIGSPSPPYGYYIAETAEECTENLKQIRSYGVMLFRHYKYLKRAALKKFSKQLAMRL